jgi:hypothetical protein
MYGQNDQSKIGSQFDGGKLSPRGFDVSYDLSPPKDGISYTR